MHGGTVSAHSGGAGRGSEFIVRLPLARTMGVAEPTPDVSEHPHTPRRRILVVNDNQDAASSLATLLNLLGHEVLMAHDGLDAIEKAKRLMPDIVMMDIGMPKLDGLETAKRLRALRGGERLKLIALTGWGQLEDRARTRAAGFDRHLIKPVDTADLQRVLQMLHENTPSSDREAI